MNRRGLLALLGLGSAGAVGGFPSNDLGPSYGGNYAVGTAGSGLVGSGSAYLSNRSSALSWLKKNGLPDYVREQIRMQSKQQADNTLVFPPEIEALKSFSPSAKRRLYAQQLATQREREALQGQISDLARDAARSLVPEPIRNVIHSGWF